MTDWITITARISWIEVLWTTIAAVGLVYAAGNLRSVWGDLDAVRPILPRNGRWLVAKAAVRLEVQRVLSQVGYVAIGLGQMTLVADYTEPARLMSGLILSFLAVAQTVHSFLDRKLRVELIRQGTGPHGLDAEPPSGGWFRRATDRPS